MVCSCINLLCWEHIHQENIYISNSSADYWNSNNMPNVTLYDGRISFSRTDGNFLWISWCRKELNLLQHFLQSLCINQEAFQKHLGNQKCDVVGKNWYYSCNRKCHIPNHGVIGRWGDVSAKLNYFGPGHKVSVQ